MPAGHPSLTPFLLLHPVLSMAPRALLDRVCGHAMATMYRRHRPVFDRMAAFHPAPPTGSTGHPDNNSNGNNFTILISPQDLGIDFTLCLGPGQPRLHVNTPDDIPQTDARITGPMPALLDLLEGRSDGDALFFSRILRIEGRTDLILALRNALDGEEIDLRAAIIESFGTFGPMSRIAATALRVIEGAYHRAQDDLDRIADALCAPHEKRHAAQQKNLDDHEMRLAAIEHQTRRRQPRHNAARTTAFASAAIDDFALPGTKDGPDQAPPPGSIPAP